MAKSDIEKVLTGFKALEAGMSSLQPSTCTQRPLRGHWRSVEPTGSSAFPQVS
jgi:hypothetical protein